MHSEPFVDGIRSNDADIYVDEHVRAKLLMSGRIVEEKVRHQDNHKRNQPLQAGGMPAIFSSHGRNAKSLPSTLT